MPLLSCRFDETDHLTPWLLPQHLSLLWVAENVFLHLLVVILDNAL